MEKLKIKRSIEDGNGFKSESDIKKRKIIDEKDIIKNSHTVNLMMMRYFFEMNYGEEDKISENKKFFENLNIAKEKINGESYIDHYQGKYPVVYLNFNKFEIKSSYNETIINFKKFIKLLYKKYDIEIGNLDDDEKEMWKKFCKVNSDINESDLMDSIMFLCECLKKILKKEIILLIEDYDSPILNAINTEFYDEFYSFYYSIFKILFENDKENCYLFKTFITGKVNSQFFNNYNSENYSIRHDKYYKYFSITDSELRKLIIEFKIEDKSEKFEKYCINNTSTFSFINPTNINNTNEVNIIISSKFFNNNNNNNNSVDNGNNNNNNNSVDNGNNNNNNNSVDD
ncbi:hypothetical protein PIROE2DRAFT_14443, partial [Piromyces sp. E2]